MSNWLSMPCPFKGGPNYTVSFAQGGRLRTELYIDAVDGAIADALYAALMARREELESAFGGPLEFEALSSRRASRICTYTDGDVTETDHHDDYIDWFFQTGTKLRTAINSVAGAVSTEIASDPLQRSSPGE